MPTEETKSKPMVAAKKQTNKQNKRRRRRWLERPSGDEGQRRLADGGRRRRSVVRRRRGAVTGRRFRRRRRRLRFGRGRRRRRFRRRPRRRQQQRRRRLLLRIAAGRAQPHRHRYVEFHHLGSFFKSVNFLVSRDNPKIDLKNVHCFKLLVRPCRPALYWTLNVHSRIARHERSSSIQSQINKFFIAGPLLFFHA